jgi:spoIIIJ-associated protein
MKKIEAATLEEAYQEAAKALDCSISELETEVIQHPSKGVMGFSKKNAIIVAAANKREEATTDKADVGDKPVAGKIKVNKKEKEPEFLRVPSVDQRVENTDMDGKKDNRRESSPVLIKNAIVDGFFEVVEEDEDFQEESVSYNELALLIEKELKELMRLSCFEIDVVEVDVVDNTVLIFLDGEGAALLIGKEGYRYNALSYMLFNWLHSKYGLFIKLEIAEFLTTQEDMIRVHLQPVIETAEKTGRAKTQFLDGVLVQVALEQLRSHFPNKYVAVKLSKEGKQFVVINEFNTQFDG